MNREQQAMKNLQDSCQELYLSYFNDFLTIEVFAKYYNLNLDQAKNVLTLGKAVHERKTSKEN